MKDLGISWLLTQVDASHPVMSWFFLKSPWKLITLAPKSFPTGPLVVPESLTLAGFLFFPFGLRHLRSQLKCRCALQGFDVSLGSAINTSSHGVIKGASHLSGCWGNAETWENKARTTKFGWWKRHQGNLRAFLGRTNPSGSALSATMRVHRRHRWLGSGLPSLLHFLLAFPP